MTFSSAYLFAKQITVGEPPIQSNIIFDSGVFNMERMQQGFDFVNNLTRCPAQMGVETARNAILGGYLHDNIDDGSILAGYSVGSQEMILESDSFSHVGESVVTTEFGTVYFLPITMRTLSEEGYTKLKIISSGNAVGIPGALPITYGGSFIIGVCAANGAGLTRLNYATTNGGQGTETETEEATEIDLSSYGSYIPDYIEVFALNGTGRIKKIWFE